MARKNINNNPNPKRSFSQKKRILRHLQEGWTLTPIQAIDLYGCTKLSTRVSELIHKEGHTEIEKKMVEVPCADGKTTRVMQYSIPYPSLFEGERV